MNRRLLIPLGVGLGVLILWFIALYSPQSSALSDARKRSSEAAAQGATLRDQLTRLQQARRDLPLKQSELETLRVAIPDDPNLAQFILDANDAASKAGIDFLSITPTPPSTSGGVTTTPTTSAGAPAGGGGAATTPVPVHIGMTATGGYFQVLDFMNRLNSLPRIVVIDSVQMTAGTGGSTLSVTFTERIFTTSSSPISGTSTGGGGAGGGTTGSSTTTTTPGGTTTTTRAGGG
ncbi:MAG: type 4a pilus biogenesis protein PilO [Acidimicrobiia bacterium]|nr:type 4a pilus biogenesis protein PilO [Acidimicrobiia bacterium]